ncbi:MAG: glycosyltransferase family 4 protein [Longimicrobiaceae bacterium]
MQRLAADLERLFATHPAVDFTSLTLRSSWRWTGLRTVPFGLRLLHRLPRLVREEGVEVVLFSSLVTASFARPMLNRVRQSGALTAAIPHGKDVTLPLAPYQRFLPGVLRALDLLLPVSRATARECTSRGADPGRVQVVPCGVDVSRFREARRWRPNGRGKTVLLSVGRHIRRKGFVWFIERVLPQLPDGVEYWLAGEGPLSGEIEGRIREGKLEERVRLLGRVSDAELADIYRAADLFVMPNVPVPGDMEGFGIVLLEAGASGLPAVAADLEGIRDVVAEGKSGTLVPAGDADGFAAAVLRYRDNPALLRAARSRAVDHVRATFSWPVVVEQHLAALGERLGAARSAA